MILQKTVSTKFLNKEYSHDDAYIDEAELWDTYFYPFDTGAWQHAGKFQGCVADLGDADETTGHEMQ